MNFLNKARRKVEEAVNDVRNTQTAQPQPQHPYPSNQQTQYNSPSQHWYPNDNQTPYQAPVQQPTSIPIHPNPVGQSRQQYFPPPPTQAQGNPAPVAHSQPGQYVEGASQQQQYYSPPPIQPPQVDHSPESYSEPRQLLGGASQQQQVSPVPLAQSQQTHLVNQPAFYPLPPSSSFNTPQPPQQPQRNPALPQVPTSAVVHKPLKCLGDPSVLPKYTQFFVLKESDSFAVCKNCFQSNVTPHQGLVDEFKPYHTISDELRFLCDFSYPRIQAIFHNQCVPQNTVQPLLSFVKLSETLSPCDGSVISCPGPFYATKEEAIPGLAVCPTCFETNLRHTAFEDKFTTILDGTYGGTNQWACDLAMPFYQRLLKLSLEKDTPDFINFAEEAKARLAIPDCPGEGKPITQFCNDTPLISTDTGGKTGNICLACYCDYISNTSLDEMFVPATLTQEQLGRITCDLSSSYSKTAIDIAAIKGDDEIWRAAVGVAGKVGQCRGSRGVDAEQLVNEKAQIGDLATWYQLNGTPSIEICPNCYWLKTKLLGADHLFSPKGSEPPPGKVLQCYMSDSKLPENMSTGNPDEFESSMAWRGRRIFNSMLPGSEMGDWSVVQAVADDIAKQLPPCGGQNRGFKRASGRKWFGRVNPDPSSSDDCTIVFCEECHSRTVKGTPHEAHYSNDLTEAAYEAEGLSGFVCQTYTNRARKILREAAQTGDLVNFARFWNLRAELRKKKDAWKPIIEAQLLKTQMANFQQSQQMLLKINAQANALSRIGSASIVEAAMSDSGERWGNSQIGNDFWTRGRAEAEQDWQNASNMQVGSGAGSIGLIGETQRLLMMAQQDENAFAAVE